MNFSISNKIRELCEDNGISLSTLERNLGFSAGLISRWDKNSPSIDKIIQVADYFNVSVDSLIGRNLENDISSLENQFVEKIIYDTKKYSIRWNRVASETKKLMQLIQAEIDNEIVGKIYSFDYENVKIYLSASSVRKKYYLFMALNDDEISLISDNNDKLNELFNEITYVVPRYQTKDIVMSKMNDYIRGLKQEQKFIFNDVYEVSNSYPKSVIVDENE